LRAPPIYIIGTERSGSNLLRVILNSHTRIDIPHPLHICNYFADLAAGYGDIGEPSARRALVTDILRLQRVHIYPWQIEIDADRVVQESTDLLSITAAIYDQHLEASGKLRWGNKSTFMVHHVQAALVQDPGARFIWLVRDPRDVAASSRRSVFSPCHPWLTASLWASQQAEAEHQAGRHPEAVLQVRYEDLLANPEGTLRSICQFIGEEFEDGLLSHQDTAAAQKGAVLSESWRNTGGPILQANAGKYKTALRPAEIAQVEQAAGQMMDMLGYTRDGPAASAPGPLGLLLIHIQDTLWRLQVEARSLVKDANHWRRWRRAALLAWLGWWRQEPAL
jgi:hypothetical protein